MIGQCALPRTGKIFEEQIEKRLQAGAQFYLSLAGEVLADCGFGESHPDASMSPDTLTLWLSAGKPLTALGIALLMDRGRLSVDRQISSVIPEFSQGGKEPITFRHVLTHTAGFRGADKVAEDLPWRETIQRICAVPLEAGWIPGAKAGYQIWSSWQILGEVIERVDGRPFERFLREEILSPLGMDGTSFGYSPEACASLGPKISRIYLSDVELRLHPTLNSPQACSQRRPGGNIRGPIRELGKFYESLLATRNGKGSPALPLQPGTVRDFTSRQRSGLFDETFRQAIDWGFGFLLNTETPGPRPLSYGYGPHASSETFGHGGAQSASGFADPKHELVVAWVCNGMPGEARHQRRALEINTAIYEELGLRG